MTDTTDIPQLDIVGSAIDALADAPLLEVYRTLLPFDDQMVTAKAVKLALAGGGGGGDVDGGTP